VHRGREAYGWCGIDSEAAPVGERRCGDAYPFDVTSRVIVSKTHGGDQVLHDSLVCERRSRGDTLQAHSQLADPGRALDDLPLEFADLVGCGSFESTTVQCIANLHEELVRRERLDHIAESSTFKGLIGYVDVVRARQHDDGGIKVTDPVLLEERRPWFAVESQIHKRNLGMIFAPLRSRFGIVHRLDFYEPADLLIIIRRSAKILNIEMDEAGAEEIARRCRGTPRIANRLLRRARDFAEVRAAGRITQAVAQAALAMLGVDEQGLDEVDRNLMLALLDKYGGGPVGVGTLAAALSEEEDAIEEIYEPYLMQIGMIDRTPRGRMATPRAYEYFGRDLPRRQPRLF